MMSKLENRIPPPLVAIFIALLMGCGTLYLPGLAFALAWKLFAAISVLAVGLGVCLAGVLSFHYARTTVNPLRPERASTLVDTGIYQYTRNPMYLGFALALVAWAIALAQPLAVLGVFAFVLYMNRFQIAPEERALSALFGEAFAQYRTRVRRWI